MTLARLSWRIPGTSTATLSLKNIIDGLHRRLKQRARRERRSVLEAVARTFEHALAAREPTSIIDVQGLGKDVWHCIDPVKHVRAERRSWR